MGTTYNITLVDRQGLLPQGATYLQQEIDQRLRQVNQQMSTYIADSELMELNRLPAGQWHRASDELFEILSLSHSLSELSAGGFDVTVRPLVELWGFGVRQTGDQLPDLSAIQEAKSALGFDKIRLRQHEGKQVKKLSPVEIDLSAIAKGYADQLALLLLSKGLKHFLVKLAVNCV